MPNAPRRLWIGLVLLALVAGVAWWTRLPPARREPGRLSDAAAERAARAYLDLEAREQAAESSIWGPEIESAVHEAEVLRWWDQLHRSADSWKTLAELPVGSVSLPSFSVPLRSISGLEQGEVIPRERSEVLDAAAWRDWIRQQADAGWRLVRTTWAVTGHSPPANGSGARSRLEGTVFLEHSTQARRLSLHLRASLLWKPGSEGGPTLDRVEDVRGTWVGRRGEPAFRLALEAMVPTERSIFVDPLLCWDLDEDGFPELVLVGADRVWRSRPAAEGQRQWVAEPWLDLPVERLVAAVRADVNGDGRDDLVVLGPQGVRWWPGQATGGPARGVAVTGWQAPTPLRHPQCLTAGDVDGDGDLDLWVTQYKLPYQGGQFPTPWDDANDGFPSYLLLNEGGGQFRDATEASGLGVRRFRRTYSASFIDLDGDGDLDLVNVSDFAGLDLFLNDGRGRFEEVSRALGSGRRAFGMSHAVADVTDDGRPDLLMLGMTSAVADRLVQAGLEREGADTTRMRDMTFGNRLFLGAAGPVPLIAAPEPWASAVARTGWTWGAGWGDLDGDGRLDLAVANGHETRASVRDYERQFWLHDRFVADSTANPVSELYFRTAAGRRQADQASYGGWQSNAVLLNAGELPWPDVAWVWGLAVPEDCRNLLLEDLNRDGRLDVVVTTQEEWPVRRQRLLVFLNALPEREWMGVEWRGPYPTGGRLEVGTGRGAQVRWFLTGDGYRSQGSSSVLLPRRGSGTIEGVLVRPGQEAVRRTWESGQRWEVLTPRSPESPGPDHR